jgi:hypothetical protein
MNAKHAGTSIKISEESHTGIKLFIPYCDTQGCQWIGDIHLDKLSAQQEGRGHLGKIKPDRGLGAGLLSRTWGS